MQDKRPEERLRESLEDVSGRLKTSFGLKKSLKMLAFIGGLCLVMLLLLILLYSVKIKSIEIIGDVTVYNESMIIEAAGLHEGDSIFSRTNASVKRSLRDELPLTESVRIKKKLSGEVIIEITFSDFEYFVCYGDKYYAVDASLRVKDVRDSMEEYLRLGARLLRLPELREPEIGEELVFYDTVEETDTEGETLYEIKEREDYAYADEFLEVIGQSEYFEKINAVILDEKFEITVIWDMKYKIVFGSRADLALKLTVLDAVLADGQLDYAEKAIIDVSDPSRAVARADLSLDFSEYFEDTPEEETSSEETTYEDVTMQE